RDFYNLASFSNQYDPLGSSTFCGSSSCFAQKFQPPNEDQVNFQNYKLSAIDPLKDDDLEYIRRKSANPHLLVLQTFLYQVVSLLAKDGDYRRNTQILMAAPQHAARANENSYPEFLNHPILVAKRGQDLMGSKSGDGVGNISSGFRMPFISMYGGIDEVFSHTGSYGPAFGKVGSGGDNRAQGWVQPFTDNAITNPSPLDGREDEQTAFNTIFAGQYAFPFHFYNANRLKSDGPAKIVKNLISNYFEDVSGVYATDQHLNINNNPARWNQDGSPWTAPAGPLTPSCLATTTDCVTAPELVSFMGMAERCPVEHNSTHFRSATTDYCSKPSNTQPRYELKGDIIAALAYLANWETIPYPLSSIWSILPLIANAYWQLGFPAIDSPGIGRLNYDQKQMAFAPGNCQGGEPRPFGISLSTANCRAPYMPFQYPTSANLTPGVRYISNPPTNSLTGTDRSAIIIVSNHPITGAAQPLLQTMISGVLRDRMVLWIHMPMYVNGATTQNDHRADGDRIFQALHNGQNIPKNPLHFSFLLSPFSSDYAASNKYPSSSAQEADRSLKEYWHDLMEDLTIPDGAGAQAGDPLHENIYSKSKLVVKLLKEQIVKY
ncbi:hypothetical protein OAO01_09175, partial [Oligoflexia bacterium]|nr:hypothetical protein [Oligoflexia bacterium]